jgi:periplasmic divalent cation tolerance protein
MWRPYSNAPKALYAAGEMAVGSEIEPHASETVVCLVTTPQANARQIASAMVDEELAACVNVVPLVHSVYRWKGKVEQDDEALLVVKTTRAAVARLDELLREIHPYENFELVALDVLAGSRSYLEWIGSSVSPAPD